MFNKIKSNNFLILTLTLIFIPQINCMQNIRKFFLNKNTKNLKLLTNLTNLTGNKTFSFFNKKNKLTFLEQEKIINKAFINACGRHDLNLIKDMLSSGVNPSSIYEKSPQEIHPQRVYSTLMKTILAIENSEATQESLEIVKLLLEAGVDVNEVDGWKKTPLYYATQKNNDDLTELLINSGANIESNEYLNNAINSGNTGVVKFLIDQATNKYGYERTKKYINMQIPDTGKTALIIACQKDTKKIGKSAIIIAREKGNQYNILKVLIDAGANLDLQDNMGMTALMWATLDNNEEVIEILLKAGANPNLKSKIDGNTALILATKINNIKIFRLLVEAQADLNLQNNWEETALIVAKEKIHIEIATLLIDLGANIDRTEYLTNAINSGNVKWVKILISQAINKYGKEWIKKYINKQMPDTGKTALILASENGNQDIIKILIEAGANLELYDNLGRTAFRTSLFWGNLDIETFKLFIKAGADINSQDIWGETALIWAAKTNNALIVEKLIKAGANLELKDLVEKCTAREIAQKKGNLKIAELIRKAQLTNNINN